MDDRLNGRVEEACLNAWPALKEILYDGWLIRLAAGRTRRINSVNVLHPGREALGEKIAACERLYRAHGLPAYFRIRSIDDPALDRMLAARGYRAEDETLTLYKDFAGGLAAVAPDAERGVELIEGGASEEWLLAQARFAGHPAEEGDIRRRLLALVALPVAFAARRDESGRIVSAAYGALHDRLVSLQWVATDPAARGRGHARANLASLMRWAAGRGAEGACLSVFAANLAAIRLYESMGFTQELYRYHYRVR
jgi:ribosomal protein S18 acetylase RimI-like enzyme